MIETSNQGDARRGSYVDRSIVEEERVPEEQVSRFCSELRAARRRIITEGIPGESVCLEKASVQVRRMFEKISVRRMMTVRPEGERTALRLNIVQIGCGSEHKRKPLASITIDVTGLRHCPGLVRFGPSDFWGSMAIDKAASA